jgi:2-keto-4-pentenoate hydratase/2-oxohepta-3-ene-1,7-dioic acid hydratase in catechol pathway
MRLCRFDQNRLGVVDGDRIRDVTAALDELPPCRYPLPPGDMLIANLPKISARARELAGSAPAVPIEGVRLLSPVANPSKIIGAPMNYRTGQDEAAIANAMSIGLFLKANESLSGQSDGIALRMMERQIDHEVELGVVIGREGANIPRQQALQHVAGYAVALDITPHGKEGQDDLKIELTVSTLCALPGADKLDKPSKPGAGRTVAIANEGKRVQS